MTMCTWPCIRSYSLLRGVGGGGGGGGGRGWKSELCHHSIDDLLETINDTSAQNICMSRYNLLQANNSYEKRTCSLKGTFLVSMDFRAASWLFCMWHNTVRYGSVVLLVKSTVMYIKPN